MYGKHFESLYDGSMFGAGPVVFAVWGYVIAKTRRSRVELNPKLLAAVLGCEVAEVEAAIKYLCAPDPSSRNREQEGRRLVKEGAFQYFVTGWEVYRAMRDEEDRREYNRLAKQKERARKASGRKRGGPGARERAAVKGHADGELDDNFEPVPQI